MRKHPSTASLILHFLGCVKETRVARIVAYLETQWGTPPATTYNVMWKLTRAGTIERVGWGRYKRNDRGQPAEDSAGAAELETKPPRLGYSLRV